jgi:hypothetical protein
MTRPHRASGRRLRAIASQVAAVAATPPTAQSAVTDPSQPLTAAQVDSFMDDGYVMLPGIMGDGPGSMNGLLRRDLDLLCEARAAHAQDDSVPVPHIVESGRWDHLVPTQESHDAPSSNVCSSVPLSWPVTHAGRIAAWGS